jgi:hypothetical protein
VRNAKSLMLLENIRFLFIYSVVVIVCSLPSLDPFNSHIDHIHVPKLLSSGANRRLSQRREYLILYCSATCRTREQVRLSRLDCSDSASCWSSSASIVIQSSRSLVDAIDEGAHNVSSMMVARAQCCSECSSTPTHGVYILR